MFTSILCIALASSVDAAARLPKVPAWQTDYSAAQKTGADARKPLAVVIGRGAAGWEGVSKDGKLDAAVLETLLSSYVCVYVDASTERGQKLADVFEMKGGLILSDHTGTNQAYRHEGTLTASDLDGVLKRFSDPERVVTRTEIHGQAEIRYYPSAAAPASNALPSYYVPSGGSNCSSCQRR